MLYFDYAATTPMKPQVIATYTEVASKFFGNGASLHDAGGQAKNIIEAARAIIAAQLHVDKEGVIFTGSGTEGNILAIVSLAKVSGKRHIITTQAEHTSVHAAMNILQQQGYRVTKLPLQQNGIIDLRVVEEAISDDTALLSIQHVNSEVGAIQPIEEIAQLAKKHNVLFHTDCVQSFGKLPIKVAADAITVSAHKIGGPKGCGALYLNRHLNVPSLTPGVTHELGLRGGTLDTPAIAAFAHAAKIMDYQRAHYTQLRSQLVEQLDDAFTIVECNNQLPSICGIFSKRYEGQYILLGANDKGIAISTGSACDIFSENSTKAIQAMGYNKEQTRRFFRVSMGEYTTIESIRELAETLNKII